MTAPAGAFETAGYVGVSAQAAAYLAQQARLAEQFAIAMATLWASTMGNAAPTEAAVRRFLSRATPLSLGAQRSMAALVVAQLQSQTRTTVPVPPEAVSGALALRGIEDEEQAYAARIFKKISEALERGRTVAEALAAGERQAKSLTRTDLQLAKTHTSRAFLTRAAENPRTRIVGYRRVLSGRGNHCALCILASTQRYRTESLAPIHPGCQCGVSPLIGTEDPGQVIDPDLASRVHEIVERDLGKSYADARGGINDPLYRDILIINDHGELGPVLGVRGQHFTKLDRDGAYVPNPEPIDLDVLLGGPNAPA